MATELAGELRERKMLIQLEGRMPRDLALASAVIRESVSSFL